MPPPTSPSPPPAEPRPSRIVQVELRSLAHGGAAVGRLPEGKAVFVPFGIPGELVRVRVHDERARFARADLLKVLTPSPDRIEPRCPLFGRCGGCALQHVAPARRRALLRQVLVDQLERIGGLVDPPVTDTVALDDWAYRNTARFAVTPGGALGLRTAGSREVVPVAECPLLHPAAQAARTAAGDDWAGRAEEVTVRAATTGEGATVIAHPGGERQATPVVERVGGFTFTISPGSFFQQHTAGAEALLALVREAAGVKAGEVALDLYAGVGLFARGLAADGARVVAVERAESAVQDARVNLAGTDAEIWQGTAEEALDELEGERVDVVVLDPPRAGAGAALMRRLTALGPRVIVYVACDPAALARDARALDDAGWVLRHAVPVDQFAQTAHLEVVATFTER